MDERLFFLYGRRPAGLRVRDLPDVARGIVAHARGHAKSSQYERHGITFVHLYGIGVDVSILVKDWKKIVPFLQNGTFNPAIIPVAYSFSRPTSEASVADLDDADFYNRVLGTLKTIFTEDFPISNL